MIFQKWKPTSIFFKNGRQPQFFQEWKTTSIFSKMEHDLNFTKIEDDFNFFKNGRRPQFFSKWKTSSFVLNLKKREDDLNSLEN